MKPLLLSFLTLIYTYGNANCQETWRVILGSAEMPFSHKVNAVKEAEDGTIWVGTANYKYNNGPSQKGGLYAFKNGKWTSFSGADLGFDQDVTINAINIKGDRLVLATSLGVLDGKPGSWKRWDKSNAPFTNYNIADAMIDRDGKLVAVQFAGGVAIYDGNEWTFLGKKQGLKNGYLYCVGQANNYFFGGQRVIVEYDGTEFIKHKKGLFGMSKELLSGIALGSSSNGDKMCIWADDCFACRGKNDWEIYSQKSTNTKMAPSAMAFSNDGKKIIVASKRTTWTKEDGTVIITGHSGIYTMDQSGDESNFIPLFHNDGLNKLPEPVKDKLLSFHPDAKILMDEGNVYDILHDSKGNYWLATEFGLLIHNPDGIQE